MGYFRKKKANLGPQETLAVTADPIVKDEDAARRQVAEKVKLEMLELFSPSWTSQSEKMLQYIYRTCAEHGYFELWDNISPVIAVKTGLDHEVLPKSVSSSENLIDTAALLNCEACFLMSTELVAEFVRQILPGTFEVRLSDDLIIQVRRDLNDFRYAKRCQNAAILSKTAQILIWSTNFEDIIPFAIKLEATIASTIWKNSQKRLMQEKGEDEDPDLEAKIDESDRPVQLVLPVMVFLTILIIFVILSLATRTIVYESLRSGTWLRFAFVLYFPFIFFLTAFFALMLVVTVMNFIGPVAQLFQNSKFYSCIPPRRITENFPHIVIQCPVYKEDLADVIIPTVKSLKIAISTYERQGGTASIFINDDGLQLISAEQRELRKAYYALNEIGWVARPGHGKNGFVRAGRFKKASNMNFAMDISLKLETKLEEIDRGDQWTDVQEEAAYDTCLAEVLQEVKSNTGHEAWAGGNIRMGDLILLIDSDTRVPIDCFLDAASEFHHSPQVAIVQHQSGVMQVVWDFWENGITYFTQCIYFSLQWATAAGDTAAFVGHNAFLRWSALQEVSNYDDNEKRTKWWSESHVSEDFEMSLKLQCKGYVSRYATYSKEGFEEGVSLTCYDELLRWSKYAYGCSELVFNPFSQWHRKGPITDIFMRFLRSDLNSFSKFTMVSYIGTYYAIALWPMLIVNYFAIGWYMNLTKQAYAFFNEGFGVFLSVLLVFNVLSPISCAASKYRARNQPFWRSCYDNFKWSIPLCLFLGGLSMHLSYALIAHMCDLNIQWGATAKTLEQVDFFVELPMIWAKFKYIYLTIFLLAALQVYLAIFAAPLDRIWSITANGPLIWLMAMHGTMPFLLNPNSYASEWTSNLKQPIRKFARWIVNLFKAAKTRTNGYMVLS